MSRVLRSLTHFGISTTETLSITQYRTSPSSKIEKSPVYQTLLLMNTLHTLTLTDCLNLPFVSALNPSQIPSRAVVCIKLKELVLYIRTKDRFCINELLEMTKERASRGAKISSIKIACLQEFVRGRFSSSRTMSLWWSTGWTMSSLHVITFPTAMVKPNMGLTGARFGRKCLAFTSCLYVGSTLRSQCYP
jgi:hypothetical protein